MRRLLSLLFVFSLITIEEGLTQPLSVAQWQAFMRKQDMVWNTMPRAWDEAPFMGNGTLGLMLYQPPGQNALKLDIGNSQVQDHRDDSYGNIAYSRPRLPIGYFTIEPVGNIRKTNLRLDVWNAETTGIIETEQGAITLRALVLATEPAIVVEWEPTAGEQNAKLTWHPLPAISPRQSYGLARNDKSRIMPGYQNNPAGEFLTKGTTTVYRQPLLAGGETATAWQEQITKRKHKLVINISHSFPQHTATEQSVRLVQRLITTPLQQLQTQHQTWWHTYLRQSFVSLPDKKLENFYWLQLYKLASATRPTGTLIDNQGPWLQPTPWPAAWWNLNVQLTYWLSNGSNHPALNESLLNALWTNRNTLIQNVPAAYRHNSAGIGRASGTDCISPVDSAWRSKKPVEGVITESVPEIGLLPWTCHNLWLYYRHTMDDAMLRNKLYPLLTRAINYYLYFLDKQPDGKYHLRYTYSPEYGLARDCNFDLALLKWGCQTLLQAAKRLQLNDPLIPVWQDVVRNLVDYPQDENGFRIGADQPYAMSHRHYSHLLMIYPLYLVNTEQPEGRTLIQRSIDHWHSKPELLRGYSFTGASSLASTIGDGNAALKHLEGLFTNFLRPNTLYAESGPVIETPLSGGQSMLDMLVQSWGNKIRVFPAVPDAWRDVSFTDLRTEGAFLVSARRQGGQTVAIKIRSLAGEPCLIKTDMLHPKVPNSPSRIEALGDGLYRIKLRKGEEVWLTPSGKPVSTQLPEVSGNGTNFFGITQ